MLPFFRDLHRSFRYLARRPLESSVAVLTLAAGIGAATAVFAFFYDLRVDRYYQGPENGRVFYVSARGPEQTRDAMSEADYLDYRREIGEHGELYGWSFVSAVVSRGPTASGSSGEMAGMVTTFGFGQAVRAGHFELFGAPAMALGRSIHPADDQPGSQPVVVLDHRFWRQEMGGDPAVIGQTLHLAGHPFTVVGVAPEGFLGHGMSFDYFLPMAQRRTLLSDPGRGEDREDLSVRPFLMLHEGVERIDAEASLARIAEQLDRDFPLEGRSRAISLTAADTTGDTGGSNGDSRGPELMLMATGVLLLLLAIVNVANLHWAQIFGRRREMAISAALGASRGLILRRFLLESLLISTVASSLGWWMAGRINGWLSDQIQITPTGMGGWSAHMGHMPMDGPIALFVVILGLSIGLGLGLVPLLVLGGSSLRGHGALGAVAAPDGLGGRRSRAALVVAQVAICATLLGVEGLLAHSLLRLQALDPGYDTEAMTIASVRATPSQRHDAGAAREANRQLHRRARQAVAALPGIEMATLASGVPGTGQNRQARIRLPELPDEVVEVGRSIIDPHYFDALGIEIVRGRAFDERDRAGAAGAVLVNESFVQQFWPDADAPLGRTLLVDRSSTDAASSTLTVVGLVRDHRHVSRRQEPTPQIFLPFEQAHHATYYVLARAQGSARAQLAPIRRALSGIDPSLAVVELDLHRRHFEFDLYMEVIFERLARIFATLALLLAAAGLYSVLGCLVSGRQRELGIRAAIGATRRDLLRLVIGGAMVLVAVGAALGFGGALLMARWVESLLFGITTLDLGSFLAATLVLALAALMATWLPALRASRVSPSILLRED